MSDATPPPPETPPTPSTPPPGTPTNYPAAPTNYPAAPPGSAAPQNGAPQNGLGVTALVMGILQFFCLPGIGSILAIVFGILGRNKAKQGLADNKGVATAGLVLGIIGLVLSVIAAIIMVFVVGWGVSKAVETVDPAKNSQTGLADGDYLMEPNAYLTLNSRCAFSGPVVDAGGMSAGDVTVVGEGAAQCGNLDSTPSAVDFTVSGGVAAITGVTP